LNVENLNVLKPLVIDYYNLVIDYQRVKLFGNDFAKKLLVLLNVLKNFLILIHSYIFIPDAYLLK